VFVVAHFKVVVFHEVPVSQSAVADCELMMAPVAVFLRLNVVPPFATATAIALYPADTLGLWASIAAPLSFMSVTDDTPVVLHEAKTVQSL
jgi:hypothetical protein